MRSPSSRRPAAAEPFLTKKPLVLGAALASLRSGEHGAIVSMQGCVRGRENGRLIRAIHYEAYAPMAEKEIRKIAAAAEKRWKVRASVRHRVGRVPVGEASVITACAGAHRRETFEACRFLIDRIKEQAPIWKVGYEWA